jgi:hypothetical protein
LGLADGIAGFRVGLFVGLKVGLRVGFLDGDGAPATDFILQAIKMKTAVTIDIIFIY